MVTALLMQKFDFKFVDPQWKMTTKQIATVKPCDLFIHAKLRTGVDILTLQGDLFHDSRVDPGKGSVRHTGEKAKETEEQGGKPLQPMSIFYGSNTGTCQGLAEMLAVSALKRGFSCTAKPLDEAIAGIPKEHPVILISSTHYGGQPPGKHVLVSRIFAYAP